MGDSASKTASYKKKDIINDYCMIRAATIVLCDFAYRIRDDAKKIDRIVTALMNKMVQSVRTLNLEGKYSFNKNKFRKESFEEYRLGFDEVFGLYWHLDWFEKNKTEHDTNKCHECKCKIDTLKIIQNRLENCKHKYNDIEQKWREELYHIANTEFSRTPITVKTGERFFI